MSRNRKARRAREKGQRNAIQCIPLLPLAAWRQHDLDWFDAHPDCSYHLRELFHGEYEPHEMPAPRHWRSLVHIRRNVGVTTIGTSVDELNVAIVEHFPLATAPADGLNPLLANQTTPLGQAALHAIWEDGREQMEADNV